MRVTGGFLRGRRLETPRGRQVRPSADRVRESLFQVLAKYMTGARVLDLYAGTGALGIEALSRGASICVFVEKDPRVAALLGRNLARLALDDRTRVVIGPVEKRLERLQTRNDRPFDLVLLDPPYNAPGIPELLGRLPALLAPGARVAWEHARGAPGPPPPLRIADERTYGQTQVTILRWG